MIDPSIWEDENFGKLRVESRLLFIGMISCADDEGYLRANSAYLKAAIFMYDDELSSESVKKSRDLLIQNMRAVHYFVVDNNEYIHFTKWEEYQTIRADRKKPSSMPKCTICQPNVNQTATSLQPNRNQMTAQVKLNKVKLSQEKGVQRETKEFHKSIDYLRKIPENDILDFTTTYNVTVRQLIDKADDLVNHCKAKGKLYKDYKAFLRVCVKKDFGLRPTKTSEHIEFVEESGDTPESVPTTSGESLPELSDEQRKKARDRIAKMKEELMKKTSADEVLKGDDDATN